MRVASYIKVSSPATAAVRLAYSNSVKPTNSIILNYHMTKPN
jgi:hypothetical protein